MEKDLPGPMTPFDELVTSPELQLIKLLIPYAPASGRQMLAAFVKFKELNETIRLFRRPGGLRAQGFKDEDRNEAHASPFDILTSFRPYLPPRQASMLDTILNLRDMMSVMEMMQAQQTQNQGAQNSEDSDHPFSVNPMDLLSGMLSPEQQEMFHMYSDLFDQSAGDSPDDYHNDPKGDEENERMDEQSGNEEYRSGQTGADPDGGGENLRQVRQGSGSDHAGTDHQRE